MAVDVSTQTVIDRPVDVVATYAGDPSHAPEWYANIKSVEWQTDVSSRRRAPRRARVALCGKAGSSG